MKRVLLGMSGGVDSSVSAILLKEAGYEVIGATMELWQEDKNQEGGCCSLSAVQDAKRVCDKLEIPHYVLNCKESFKEKVVFDFIKCYQNARTPNPCVECNKYIKFGVFYQKAKELKCDYIATGHYAKIAYSEKYQQYVLEKSKTQNKDQTYFLYGIPREVLSHVLFPLAEYETKEQIRKIAKEHDLLVADKPDSQEVCFIPDNNYVGFLKKRETQKIEQGEIVTTQGEILGKHQGLFNYTIGQRKGLGISYSEPLYVIQLDKQTNKVIVGTENELYRKELYASELNFLVGDSLKESIQVKAKIRYRAREAEAVLYPIDKNTIKIKFKEPQKAITPGQSIVFYQDDIVIGGGKIE